MAIHRRNRREPANPVANWTIEQIEKGYERSKPETLAYLRSPGMTTALQELTVWATTHAAIANKPKNIIAQTIAVRTFDRGQYWYTSNPPRPDSVNEVYISYSMSLNCAN
ncbi:hypothetical protein EDC01DRAFT_630794 [Geopyxis carbonaria]|nr:hypothetical protein EDC01DRAFT_630794 [Geopyxis carbonaria]